MLLAMNEHFDDMIREVDDFLVGKSKVHRTLARLTRSCEDAGVEFVLAGALAVAEHGHLRLTVDVDVVVSEDGLRRFKERWLGRDYVEKFSGSRGVRDVETQVQIDFLLAGEFPGDGKPKPVCFPDPGNIPKAQGVMRVLDLRTLIELKLASGISASDRLQDLADVVALVRVNRLPVAFSDNLDLSVRDKFTELWHAANEPRREF